MSRRLRRPRLSAATPPEVETRDPAASMALILEAMRHPLDPLYEDVAHRRREQGPAHEEPRWRRAVALGIITLVVGVLIGCAASALRVPKKVETSARSQLVDEIQRKQRVNDDDSREIARLRGEVAGLQGSALGRSSHGGLRQDLTTAETAAGVSATSGAGLELKLDNPSTGKGQDSADSDPRTSGSATQLSSSDLQRVVNGLWQAGATGISINDQRLTSLSAIRFAGSAILVNFRPLTTPYVVRAVGPSSLVSQFPGTDGGSYLSTLTENGFTASTSAKSRLDLPAAAAATISHAKVTK